MLYESSLLILFKSQFQFFLRVHHKLMRPESAAECRGVQFFFGLNSQMLPERPDRILVATLLLVDVARSLSSILDDALQE
jgi:hypothetical protein